jgi:hypothetical protein
VNRVAAGPLLGWVCLALAPAIAVAYWWVAVGHVDGGALFAVPVMAAGALNASTWLAAILFGRTRQLRASWLALAAVLVALAAASAVWPDFLLVAGTALLVLGFPSSMIILLAASQGPLPHLPWGLERAIPAAETVGIMVFAYLQPFVLLPRLFRWRAERASPSQAPHVGTTQE